VSEGERYGRDVTKRNDKASVLARRERVCEKAQSLNPLRWPVEKRAKRDMVFEIAVDHHITNDPWEMCHGNRSPHLILIYR
jgi:hypothetical protein